MTILSLALAFFLGSLPFSWILVWLLRGVDLREVGSGNPGATNAYRVVGRCWGSLALALDIGKGLAAVLAAPRLAGPDTSDWLPAVCGGAAIIGNVFSPFLRFKGGKAVATGAGVFAGLAPIAFTLVGLAFLAVFQWTKQVSTGSLAGAVLLPALVTVEAAAGWGDDPPAAVVALVWFAAAVVLVRHRSNIARLFRGEEYRFGNSNEK